MSGDWVGMNLRLGSGGTIDQRICTWPLHVLGLPHSMVAQSLLTR